MLVSEMFWTWLHCMITYQSLYGKFLSAVAYAVQIMQFVFHKTSFHNEPELNVIKKLIVFQNYIKLRHIFPSSDFLNYFFRRIVWLAFCLIILQNLAPSLPLDRAACCQFNYSHLVLFMYKLKLKNMYMCFG